MTNVCWHCKRTLAGEASFCTHCGASLKGKESARETLQHKKEKVLGKQQSEQRRKLRPFLIVVVILVTGGWLVVNLPKKTNPVIVAQPVVAASMKYPDGGQQMFDIPVKIADGKIIVPLNVVMARKFISFLYSNSDNSVPLLAYISNEGRLVTAVSMCEPCNSKRFHIQGEKLVCNSCGSTWELNNLDAVSGACGKYPPDAIPSVISGNEIQIDEAVVANWQRRI